ncbi:hypothetical protein Tsubulata_039005 [Turnera subulata]|uniref:Uncharacterized protein n=1 Tax=Turnera subulata TaxID=218843 RepID=A0A9Q0IYM5_9ROSI|nr:hypothetical protein Tsubulata_039005 [Turnera subulata]
MNTLLRKAESVVAGDAVSGPDPDAYIDTGSEEKAHHESTMDDDDTGSDSEEVDDEEVEDDEYPDSPSIPFRETLDEVHRNMYEEHHVCTLYSTMLCVISLSSDCLLRMKESDNL